MPTYQGYANMGPSSPVPSSPPIGLVPRDIWELKNLKGRKLLIKDAIRRYNRAGYVVPQHWKDEYMHILTEEWGVE